MSSTYDTTGTYRAISAASASAALWLAGTGSASTDPATGPYDALNRLASEKWDSGAVAKTRSFFAGSNLVASAATSATQGSVTSNVYTMQMNSWQGSLMTAYTITSAWDGGGTSYGASYDSDGHLKAWNAAAIGGPGSATQQFNENYTFSLENFQQISTVNNLGRTITASYNYNDSSSKERVTSIVTTPTAPVADYFSYDRRGRGLITTHSLSSAQNPPQDSYQYDVQDRLISISRLGAKVEDLSYDATGQLVGRAFTSGSDTARYYIGDDLTVAVGTSRTVGYVHVRLGGRRIASIWAKSAGTVSTNGTIYYHRDSRSSVVATTTARGAIGISYRYLPSGAVDKVVGTEADETTSELGFTGGIKLSGGLIHLRARAYSPLLRRFLQPDTVDLRRYTHAGGDSMNFIDPSGRQAAPNPNDKNSAEVPWSAPLVGEVNTRIPVATPASANTLPDTPLPGTKIDFTPFESGPRSGPTISIGSFQPTQATTPVTLGSVSSSAALNGSGSLLGWSTTSGGRRGGSGALSDRKLVAAEYQAALRSRLDLGVQGWLSIGEALPFVGYGLAKGLFTALRQASERILGSVATEVTGVQANRFAGNAFRNEIARALRAEGRAVETEIYKRTPFGKRFIDLEVSYDGQLLGGIETKLGGSPYTSSQRAKDTWLLLFEDYRVNVVRGP
jgi:RHS repeat-associated protein